MGRWKLPAGNSRGTAGSCDLPAGCGDWSAGLRGGRGMAAALPGSLLKYLFQRHRRAIFMDFHTTKGQSSVGATSARNPASMPLLRSWTLWQSDIYKDGAPTALRRQSCQPGVFQQAVIVHFGYLLCSVFQIALRVATKGPYLEGYDHRFTTATGQKIQVAPGDPAQEHRGQYQFLRGHGSHRWKPAPQVLQDAGRG